jgi:hypothetical protein
MKIRPALILTGLCLAPLAAQAEWFASMVYGGSAAQVGLAPASKVAVFNTTFEAEARPERELDGLRAGGWFDYKLPFAFADNIDFGVEFEWMRYQPEPSQYAVTYPTGGALSDLDSGVHMGVNLMARHVYQRSADLPEGRWQLYYGLGIGGGSERAEALFGTRTDSMDTAIRPNAFVLGGRYFLDRDLSLYMQLNEAERPDYSPYTGALNGLEPDNHYLSTGASFHY